MSERWHKRFWVRWLRETYKFPKERQPCIVCGKYASITEVHHVFPIFEMASLLERSDIEPHQMAHAKFDVVWLCPNHHTLFHAIYSSDMLTQVRIIQDIGEEEYRSLKILWDLQDVDKLMTMLIEAKNATNSL